MEIANISYDSRKVYIRVFSLGMSIGLTFKIVADERGKDCLVLTDPDSLDFVMDENFKQKY